MSGYGSPSAYGTAYYGPGSGIVYPDRVAGFQLLIGGVDVSAYLKPDSLRIDNVLTRQADTCTFVLENAGSLSIREWQEIIVLIEYGSSASHRIFGGMVQRITSTIARDNISIDLSVQCTDYTCLLDKSQRVKGEWNGKTDAEIIQEIFTDYLPEIDVRESVETVATHDRWRVVRKSLLEVMDALSKAAGTDWYIDYNKLMHYFLTSSEVAPFSVTDDPAANLVTEFPFADMRVDRDGTGVVNRIEFAGGNYLSDNATIYVAGTGKSNKVSLPFKMSAPVGGTSIQVWRNDGTDASPVWTAMSVKAGYIDTLTGTGDALYYYQEKVLEQQNNWPALSQAVKIYGRYEIPLMLRAFDAASVAHYGRYLDGQIIDKTIVDRTTARMLIASKLAQSAFANPSIYFNVYKLGLRAGQTIAIKSTANGINATYMIQRAAISFDVGGYLTVTVDAGTYNEDLIDLFIQLNRRTKGDLEWTDESLNDLIALSESIVFRETCTITAS